MKVEEGGGGVYSCSFHSTQSSDSEAEELVPRVMESLVTIGDVLDTDEKEALFQFDVIGDSSQTRRGD